MPGIASAHAPLTVFFSKYLALEPSSVKWNCCCLILESPPLKKIVPSHSPFNFLSDITETSTVSLNGGTFEVTHAERGSKTKNKFEIINVFFMTFIASLLVDIN